MMERLTIDEVIEHCNKTCDMTEKIAKERGRELESIESNQFWEHYQVRAWLKELKRYKDLEEQGLLLRLPCNVGDTVYCIYERYTKCSENEQEFDEYSCQGCECLECDSHKELYVQSQKAYSLDWIVSNLKRFGKTVFLTQAEAEQKLKEMESVHFRKE